VHYHIWSARIILNEAKAAIRTSPCQRTDGHYFLDATIVACVVSFIGPSPFWPVFRPGLNKDAPVSRPVRRTV
jgi:hypothetical protein